MEGHQSSRSAKARDIRVGQGARVGGPGGKPPVGDQGAMRYSSLVEHTDLQGDSSEISFVN